MWLHDTHPAWEFDKKLPIIVNAKTQAYVPTRRAQSYMILTHPGVESDGGSFRPLSAPTTGTPRTLRWNTPAVSADAVATMPSTRLSGTTAVILPFRHRGCRIASSSPHVYRPTTKNLQDHRPWVCRWNREPRARAMKPD